ncbi:hypothetical protein SteCoe_18533 [Stentor coeruleus]|uniref:Uncharacterized protein n=1 Tax=Stentor coeruleus TaxID=5963 RepID=A0A1R2BWD2_9CILI|nr:hypothetical protein SteCoe_18533 [Stentor coeruleus]
MESPKKVNDPTLNRKILTRNTFNTIFPVYSTKVKDFMSSTHTSFTSELDFGKHSEFVTHNKDTMKKINNKKVDRIVQYTESMLKIKNLVKLNKK